MPVRKLFSIIVKLKASYGTGIVSMTCPDMLHFPQIKIFVNFLADYYSVY